MKVIIIIFMLFYFNSASGQLDFNDSLLINLNQKVSKGTATSDDFASRAYILTTKNEFKKALKDINKAIDLIEQSPNDTFHIFKAELFETLGKKNKVLGEAQKALSINYNTHNLLAAIELAYDINAFDECIQYANEYLIFDQKNPKVFYYKGASFLAKGMLESAVHSALIQAIKLKGHAENPEKLEAYSLYQLGLYHYKKKNWDSSLTCFLDIYNNHDSLIEVMNLHYGLGECYFLINEYSKAIFYLSKYNSQEDWYNVQYLLGRSYEYLELYQNASDYYSIIIKDHDKNNIPYATLHRGICQFYLGNFENSIKDLRKAKRKWYEDEPILYFYLSQSYFDSNQHEKACNNLREGLLSENENNSETKEMLLELMEKYGCPSKSE